MSLKKNILLFSFGIIAFTNAWSQTAKECSVYTPVKPVIRAKGQDVNPYVLPEKTSVLPRVFNKTREVKAKNLCAFQFYNYNEQPIHVYVDSVYAGTIEPNRVGVLQDIKSESHFYCITEDQEYSWEDEADCSCKLIFHLRIKKYTGEVKFD